MIHVEMKTWRSVGQCVIAVPEGKLKKANMWIPEMKATCRLEYFKKLVITFIKSVFYPNRHKSKF